MKNIKHFSIVIAILLCIGMLVGCGTIKEVPPTPEELLEKAFGPDPVDSLNITMTTDIDANIDMSAVGMDDTVGITCIMAMDMAGDKEGNVSTNGSIDYRFLSVTQSEKVKSYEIVSGDNVSVYTYDNETESWSKRPSTIKNGESFIKSVVDILDSNNFDEGSLVLAESDENTSNYIVKGTIKMANLKGSMSALNSIAGSENLLANDLSFNVEVEFDKDTRLVKTVTLSLDTENASEEVKETYKNLTMMITVNQINNVEIVLPSDVEESLNTVSTEPTEIITIVD